MPRNLRSCLVPCCAGLTLLAMMMPADAVPVGWNVDIHQGKFNGNLPPPAPGVLPGTNVANDFHVWGVVESMLTPPILLNQVNFQTTGPFGIPPWQVVPGGLVFPNFGSMFSQVPPFPKLLPPPPPPMPPIVLGGPFYYFMANWSGANIPFCTWMHFGLLFRVNGANYGYWLRAVWTWNGIDPPGQPIYGFEVSGGGGGGGTVEPARIRIGNSSGVETYPMTMDLMVLNADEGRAFPLEDLNTSFFDTHPEWNQRWVPVPALLVPPYLPSSDAISSFFDVYLDQVPGLPPLLPGQILLARQHSAYNDSAYPGANFWQYEIHGQTLPGDADDNGHVDVNDLLAVAAAWGSVAGSPTYNPLTDFDLNGTVNVVDLLTLAPFWGW